MNQIQIGTGIVDITPPIGHGMAGYPHLQTRLPGAPPTMQGYAGREGVASGKHDPLLATCLVVNDGKTCAAIFGIDTLYIGRRMLAEIRSAAQAAGVDEVFVGASHTHSGPDLLGIWGGDDSLVEEATNGIIDALRQALNHLAPASMAVGWTEVPSVTVNRASEGMLVDRSMAILSFHTDEEVRAALVCFACHPLTLDPSNLLYSADFVHPFRKAFRAVYPTATVIFLNGCAGDINPARYPYSSGDNIIPLMNAEAYPAHWGGLEDAERLGRVLAGHAIVATASAETVDDWQLRAAVVPVQLAVRPSAEIRWYAEYVAAEPHFVADLLDARVARSEVLGIAFGDVVLIGLPGEPFSEIGLEIRSRLEAGGARQVVVAGYTNDYISYVLPEHAYKDNRYERAATYLAAGAASLLVTAAEEAWTIIRSRS